DARARVALGKPLFSCLNRPPSSPQNAIHDVLVYPVRRVVPIGSERHPAASYYEGSDGGLDTTQGARSVPLLSEQRTSELVTLGVEPFEVELFPSKELSSSYSVAPDHQISDNLNDHQ